MHQLKINLILQMKHMTLTEQKSSALSNTPFSPSPVTKKYAQAFDSFYDHFSKKMEDVRNFQKEGIQLLRKVFQIFLKDLFLILGPPPCEYDIRATGFFGREEILPSLDLECLLLVEKIDKDYFSSFMKIVEAQFLSQGKKIKWQIIEAQVDFIPAFLRTTSLAQSSPKLFSQGLLNFVSHISILSPNLILSPLIINK